MTQALTHYDPSTSGMDLMTLGQTLARSGYFQDTREAAQAVVKVLAGAEMGIGPIAAMTGIYLVKGRVTLSANLMAAQIKRSGKYDYRIIRMDDAGCTILFFQGSEQVGESTFDEADAKAAGLLGGDNWKKFPRNMYFARAMSNGAKWYCPDVFSGPVYTPDELSAAPAPYDGGDTYIPPAPSANPVTGEAIGPPATQKQRNYIAGLQDDLGWHSEALIDFAKGHGVDDLVTMTSAQASALIEAMKQEGERLAPPPAPNGKPSAREALEARLEQTIKEARALGIDVADADQIAGESDAALIAAGKKLRTAINKAKQEDDLFPGEPAGHVSDGAELPL